MECFTRDKGMSLLGQVLLGWHEHKLSHVHALAEANPSGLLHFPRATD
jgi:hypothetical protein